MDEIPVGEDSSNIEVAPADQREQEATPTTSTPKPAKRWKGKGDDANSSMINSAFEILKNTANKLDKKPTEPNEVDTFFNYCAAKVHKYSPEAQKAVQHSMFEILMKADRGFFEASNYQQSYNYQQPYSWQNVVENVPLPPHHQPQHVVPPPLLSPPDEVSLLTNSSQQSWQQQSPTSSITSERLEDLV